MNDEFKYDYQSNQKLKNDCMKKNQDMVEPSVYAKIKVPVKIARNNTHWRFWCNLITVELMAYVKLMGSLPKV